MREDKGVIRVEILPAAGGRFEVRGGGRIVLDTLDRRAALSAAYAAAGWLSVAAVPDETRGFTSRRRR